MIVDGKVRKMKFSEKVRENFQKFKEVVERKGRDVLVAGIIGTGVLFGVAKAQSADSLVVDTSSVHIDSTYIDWSKPRFMGLTYGYYKKEEELRYIVGKAFKTCIDYGASFNYAKSLCDSLYYSWVNEFPYSVPLTRQDTLSTIKYYLNVYYGVQYNELPTDEYIINYTIKYPNRAAAFLYDLDIIKRSQYWTLLLGSK